MQVRELLKDFDIENVSKTILDYDTKCTNVEEYSYLFKGALLIAEDGLEEVSINLEAQNEFARLAIFTYSNDGYLMSETGFDDDMNILYVNNL